MKVSFSLFNCCATFNSLLISSSRFSTTEGTILYLLVNVSERWDQHSWSRFFILFFIFSNLIMNNRSSAQSMESEWFTTRLSEQSSWSCLFFFLWFFCLLSCNFSFSVQHLKIFEYQHSLPHKYWEIRREQKFGFCFYAFFLNLTFCYSTKKKQKMSFSKEWTSGIQKNEKKM